MSVVWRAPKTGLHLGFLVDVSKLLEESPYAWYVISAHRPIEEQERLWKIYQAGGPRAAPPGKSAHNYGLAVDVVLDYDPDKPGLQPSWDTKLAGWLWLKAVTLKHPRLKGGWRFGDWPHIEKYKWQLYAPVRPPQVSA